MYHEMYEIVRFKQKVRNIYIYRERERDRQTDRQTDRDRVRDYVFIFILYIYIYTLCFLKIDFRTLITSHRFDKLCDQPK